MGVVNLKLLAAKVCSGGLTQVSSLSQEVDLAQDVDVREFHLQHRAQGQQE